MHSKKCFIVEDDLVSAQYLKEILEQEGIETVGIADKAEEALEQLRGCPVDIVLMDIILRGALSGSEAAVMLKQRYPQCQILFLTAYADDEMVEYALDAHAAAYLMKPYREKEIIATVRMILEQNRPPQVAPMTRITLSDGFVYDLENSILKKGQTIIPLSSRKIKLIETLAINQNSIVSNEQLSIAIWGEPQSDSNLRSLISRFRKQIGAGIITNINGIGYTLA
jgi:DNA-binding response OmpR family regulator